MGGCNFSVVKRGVPKDGLYMFLNLRYMLGIKRVQEDILLALYGTADSSRMFLSFFVPLQYMLPLIASGRGFNF